jgi:FG-GAP-like repeat/FG-GAP repeat
MLMNRRAFGKLVAGIASTSILPDQRATAFATGQTPVRSGDGLGQTIRPAMKEESEMWELIVLDAAPAGCTELAGTAVGDIDGDGKPEVVISASGALLWYNPRTFERGEIARGTFNVGVAVEDVDGDGRKEIVASRLANPQSGQPEHWSILWYKAGNNGAWTEHVLDPQTTGSPHDLVLGDLDNDGRPELIANAMYCDTPGLHAYKPTSDVFRPWTRIDIQTGIAAEGTALGDLNRDGRLEVISGPWWYTAPKRGAFSEGAWERRALAPGFREYCRVALADINGDGWLDAVVVENEYPDGRLCWFENCMKDGSDRPFIEHPMDVPLNFAHTLRSWRDSVSGNVVVFVAEMNEGGWGAPYNWNARLLNYEFSNRGQSWERHLVYRGEGTHEAMITDLNGDGQLEIVGHSAQITESIRKQGKDTSQTIGWVQLFQQVAQPSPLFRCQHRFLDRQKPGPGIEMVIADVDGDGRQDILCGSWWYRSPAWERFDIPGIYQVINAYDINKDGRKEIIAIKRRANADDWYSSLSSELCWLKPIDPAKGKWEEHVIGTGDGDWPHGSTVGPFLPGGGLALVCGYHDPKHSPPQIFEIPANPAQGPWKKRLLADIPYGEQLVAFDLDGDGKLDIVAGPYWLENLGNGGFTPHLLAEGFTQTSRVAIADINGNGRPDIVLTVEDLNYEIRKTYFAPVAWLENTGDPRSGNFKPHIIDRIRSPHSLTVADLDGDGEPEILVGEHDPFKPYRSQCRLYIYKKADRNGTAWKRYVVDDRFEHHDGGKLIDLGAGRMGIASHGWVDTQYVHLWEIPAKART